jgi:protein ImuB
MLPDPVPVRVRSEGGHPVELEEPEGKQDLVLSEGPERFSGDWWKAPYHREYFRACTAGGEILWLFREYRRGGGDGGGDGGDNDTWWLHGYWD